MANPTWLGPPTRAKSGSRSKMIDVDSSTSQSKRLGKGTRLAWPERFEVLPGVRPGSRFPSWCPSCCHPRHPSWFPSTSLRPLRPLRRLSPLRVLRRRPRGRRVRLRRLHGRLRRPRASQVCLRTHLRSLLYCPPLDFCNGRFPPVTGGSVSVPCT